MSSNPQRWKRFFGHPAKGLASLGDRIWHGVIWRGPSWRKLIGLLGLLATLVVLPGGVYSTLTAVGLEELWWRGGVEESSYPGPVAPTADNHVTKPDSSSPTPSLTPEPHCDKPSRLGSVTVVAPNGGEKLAAFDVMDVQWRTSNDLRLPSVVQKVWYSVDGGSSWEGIVTWLSGGDGMYLWVVPDVASANALVCVEVVVSGTGVAASDMSDGPFEIVSSASESTTSTAPSPCERVYTLVEGDTLLTAAERFGATYADLLSFNGLTEGDAQSLQPGDQIANPACE